MPKVHAIQFDSVNGAMIAKLLNMDKNGINNYLDSLIMRKFQNLSPLEIQYFGKIKAYIYKQGVIRRVLAVLRYELSDVRTALTNLYTTLENNTGGLADFLSSKNEPMSNETIEQIYTTIDKGIKKATAAGYIRETEAGKISQWALARIYELQNRPELMHAIDIYKGFKFV